MEEELQKRNTDCVYFLASPLTCKKGSECEYRHSESARLNPRDCWYWLSGNCLNPTCAFRHPPLDGRPEISFDRFHVPLNTPGDISKTNVPCYFYFNAYCTKGDACPFLHGPDGALPGWKPTKAASAGMDTQAFEKKSSGQIDTGPGSVEECHSLAVSKMVNVQLQSKDVGQVEASNNLIEHSPSSQISVPDCEDGAGKLLDPLPSVAHFINNERPLLCSDQSSEEPADDRVEPEERWESSPGFDVLVDDGSDQLGYEDDTEYLLGHDGEAGRRLHSHLLNYDYEDQVRYDPMDFPRAGILYENGGYDCKENNHLSEHVRRIPEHPRGRMLERNTSRRRKLMHRELEVDYRNGDLRDHLRKRKRDSHHTSFSSQKHGSCSHIIEGSRKRSTRQTGGRRLNGRLASEANSESESGLNGTNRPCRRRGSRSKHSRPRLGKERRKTNGRELPHLSSEISRDVTLKSTDPTLEFTAFTGPKTLAQIKEEKRRARSNEDDTRNMGSPLCTYKCQGMPADFQGPKPLSELIKHKKEKLGSENENVGFCHILS